MYRTHVILRGFVHQYQEYKRINVPDSLWLSEKLVWNQHWKTLSHGSDPGLRHVWLALRPWSPLTGIIVATMYLAATGDAVDNLGTLEPHYYSPRVTWSSPSTPKCI